MKAAEIQPILERWAAAVTRADKALEPLRLATGMHPESPLSNAVGELLTLADHWAAECIGVAPDWMDWYRLENKMGARGHEAGWDDDVRKIHTLHDLSELLAEELRRAAAFDLEAVH